MRAWFKKFTILRTDQDGLCFFIKPQKATFLTFCCLVFTVENRIFDIHEI